MVSQKVQNVAKFGDFKAVIKDVFHPRMWFVRRIIDTTKLTLLASNEYLNGQYKQDQLLTQLPLMWRYDEQE